MRAFESDIRSVLAAVRSIEIRGSRRLALDAGFIDRVILAPPFQSSEWGKWGMDEHRMTYRD